MKNDIVERANNDVNRHIRNIMFDEGIKKMVENDINDRQVAQFICQTTACRIPQHRTHLKCVPR